MGDTLSGINGTTALRNRQNWLKFVKGCLFYIVLYMRTQGIAWRYSELIYRIKKKIFSFFLSIWSVSALGVNQGKPCGWITNRSCRSHGVLGAAIALQGMGRGCWVIPCLDEVTVGYRRGLSWDSLISLSMTWRRQKKALLWGLQMTPNWGDSQ